MSTAITIIPLTHRPILVRELITALTSKIGLTSAVETVSFHPLETISESIQSRSPDILQLGCSYQLMGMESVDLIISLERLDADDCDYVHETVADYGHGLDVDERNDMTEQWQSQGYEVAVWLGRGGGQLGLHLLVWVTQALAQRLNGKILITQHFSHALNEGIYTADEFEQAIGLTIHSTLSTVKKPTIC